MTKIISMTSFRKRLIMYGVTAIIFAAVIVWTQTRPAVRWTFVHDFAHRNGLQGGVIAYGKSADQPPFIFAFGFADNAAGRKVIETDRFKIASLTKPITAEAIVRMSDLGLVDLDRPIADYFAEVLTAVDPRMADVTVRHLLQHRAGWDAAEAFEPFLMTRGDVGAGSASISGPDVTCESVAEAMLKFPLQFSPGSKFVYSNVGYCWLGMILAQSGFGSFENAVKVLVPSIQNFSFDLGQVTVVPPDEVRIDANVLVNDPKIVSSAGGMITDAVSYFRFAVAPKDPRIVERPNGEVGPLFYGLGWRIRNLPQGTFLTHIGSMPGAYSIVIRDIKGPTIVALFNGGTDKPFEVFAEFLAEVLARGFPEG